MQGVLPLNVIHTKLTHILINFKIIRFDEATLICHIMDGLVSNNPKLFITALEQEVNKT